MESYVVSLDLSVLPLKRYPEALRLAYEALRREVPRKGYLFRCEGSPSGFRMIAEEA